MPKIPRVYVGSVRQTSLETGDWKLEAGELVQVECWQQFRAGLRPCPFHSFSSSKLSMFIFLHVCI